MNCPKCKKDIPDGSKKCPECGAVFKKKAWSFEDELAKLDKRFLSGDVSHEQYMLMKDELQNQDPKLETVEKGDESIDLSDDFSWDDSGSGVYEGPVSDKPPENFEEQMEIMDDGPVSAEEPIDLPPPPEQEEPDLPPPPAAKASKAKKITESSVMSAHTEAVHSISFTGDSKYLFSGSDDITLKLWSAMTGKLAKSFPGKTYGYTAVAIAHDGMFAVVGDREQKLYVVNMLTGKTEIMGSHEKWITSVDISPDGKFAVSGSGDGKACLWEVGGPRQPKVLQSGQGGINTVSFSPSGKSILAGGAEKNVRAWDIVTGDLLCVFRGHTDEICSARFSPNELNVVTASKDKTLKVYEMPAGKEIMTLSGHKDQVLCVAVGKGGKYALSGGGKAGKTKSNDRLERHVKLWDLDTGEEVCTFIGHEDSVTSVAISPNGKYAASASMDKTIRLWKMPE